jgi:hypothetical protein
MSSQMENLCLIFSEWMYVFKEYELILAHVTVQSTLTRLCPEKVKTKLR